MLNMKVVSFVNMKGGVGKTTLAVNIADFLRTDTPKRYCWLMLTLNLMQRNV